MPLCTMQGTGASGHNREWAFQAKSRASWTGLAVDRQMREGVMLRESKRMPLDETFRR